MVSRLIRKLENFAPLDSHERESLSAAVVGKRRLGPGEIIDIENDTVRTIRVVEEGWACSSRVRREGGRQILAIWIPGDLCGPSRSILHRVDGTLHSLTPLTLLELSVGRLRTAVERHPRIGDALLWDEQVGGAIQRERLVSLGRRNSKERMAHLLCELFHRLRAVDLTDGPTCAMPMTQEMLADALGMTAVHANRSLKALRGQRLIELRDRRLRILDHAGLARVAEFTPDHLHLVREATRAAPPTAEV